MGLARLDINNRFVPRFSDESGMETDTKTDTGNGTGALGELCATAWAVQWMRVMVRRSRFRSAAVVVALLVAGIQGCASARRAERTTQVPSGYPVTGVDVSITSDFGAPRGRSRHEGIDLSAPAGTAVRATADGTVVFAGRAGAYGRTVLLDHGNGWQTRYAHLKRIKTERGTRVTRGTVVGAVGQSGNASGAHLHYEVLRNGTPIDPRPYLNDPPHGVSASDR